ncbi:hypothetical protein AB8878_07330 [Alphaproteobacteria bacterium LSUCC0226]
MTQSITSIFQMNTIRYVCRNYTKTSCSDGYDTKQSIDLECELASHNFGETHPFLNLLVEDETSGNETSDKNILVRPLNLVSISIGESAKDQNQDRYNAYSDYPIYFHLGMEKREFEKAWKELDIDSSQEFSDDRVFMSIYIRIGVPSTTAVRKERNLIEISSFKFDIKNKDGNIFQSTPFPLVGECRLDDLEIVKHRNIRPKKFHRFDHYGDPI